jgi:hypothetical protein
MSAFGTAKMPTTSLNTGFPAAFGYAYAQYGEPETFYPEGALPSVDNTVGHDFQAMWHQQKMRDAHYMAGAKVRSTHAMNARAFSSAHGYFGMPPPVLGQRKFANPSFGAYPSGNSARMDQPGAPWHIMEGTSGMGIGMGSNGHLEGGVLRTSAGQRHGRATLLARIAQLNAISAAKMNFQSQGAPIQLPGTPFAGAAPSIDAMLGATPLVELAQILQNIKENLYLSEPDQPGRDSIGDFGKLFPLIVRMATANPPSDIANVLGFIEGSSGEDGIIQLLRHKIDTMEEAGFDADNDQKARAFFQRSLVQSEWWGRVVEYLKKMIEIAESPAKNRQAASNAYVKSLGFGKLGRDIGTTYRTNVVPADAFIDTTGNVNNAENAQRAVAGQARAGRSGAFINPYESVFSRRAETRENSQHGYVGDGGQQFSLNAQNAYAFGSGEFQDNTGGRPRAWAGEEALAEYGGTPDESEVAIAEQTATGQSADLESQRETNEAAMARDRGDEESEFALTSTRDPVTGEYNIVRGSPDRPPWSPLPSTPPWGKPAGVAAAPAAAAPGQKRYKFDEIPRTIPTLKAFIAQLEREIPGYKQKTYTTIYGDPKARSVRAHTVSKLEKLGLLDR